MLCLPEIYKSLHQIPELAFKENKTKALVKSQIEALLREDVKKAGYFKLYEFQNSTGLLVDYQLVPGGDYKLFRADMDALPLHEKTGVDYQSHHEGMMHACGHDLHITVLLGLIQKVWEALPPQNLLFLFQPAEEGEGGAQSVLAEGLLQSFPVKEVYALHASPDLPVGTISSKGGSFFAIPQEFDLTFKGRAAHVAFPEKGIDAIAAAAEFYHELKASTKKMPTGQSIIIHIGKIMGGQIRNVIADEAVLQGTHRSLSRADHKMLNELLAELAESVGEKYGAEAELKLLGTYDPVVNDAGLFKQLKESCERLGYSFFEAETVMTGEDFGFFTTRYDGLLFWLGVGLGEALHSPRFLPDPAAIEVGVDVFYALV